MRKAITERTEESMAQTLMAQYPDWSYEKALATAREDLAREVDELEVVGWFTFFPKHET